MRGEEVWTVGNLQNSKLYEKAPGKPGLNSRPTNIAAWGMVRSRREYLCGGVDGDWTGHEAAEVA
jgi:hypothetical protein